MAEKLQSTTVSRGYLQSIVNSMGEALFVVSRSGIIQMANPAAEQLLGYQQGQLAERALSSIAGLDSASARARDAL
jgi:PAS domain S-box-containing protein